MICVFAGIAVAPSFFPAKNGFPYGEFADTYGVPPLVKKLTNFDGVQYLIIADHRDYYTYQQAYFPLYPLILALTGVLVGGNLIWAGLLLNICLLILALTLWRNIYPALFGLSKGSHPVREFVWLLLLPGSFFFLALYTESLFLCLLLALIWALLQKKYVLVFIIGYLLGLTRLIGTATSIIIFLAIWQYPRIQKNEWLNRLIQSLKDIRLLSVFGPLMGLLTYMSYLTWTLGDPLAFINAQTAFNNNRSTHIITLPQVVYRYIKIFSTAEWNLVYLVSLVEFVTFVAAIFFVYRLIRHYRSNITTSQQPPPGLWWGVLIFSVINLILPTLTGTFSSMPRYSLLSLTTIMGIHTLSRPVRYLYLTACLLINLILLVLFAQGYFVS